MDEIMVTITLEEYKELCISSNDLQTIMNVIVNSARLNYAGDGLSFDSENISTIFKAIYPNDYNKTIEELRAKKEIENE